MPMIFVLLMAVLMSLAACGGDSGNSSNPAPEEDLNSSSGTSSRSSSSGTQWRYSSSYSITSATTVIDDDAKDVRNDEPFYGEVTDSSSGNVYSTRSIGVYTWTENISDKNASVKSTCYAYDDSYCGLYGRLYMKKNADDLCPSGFSFPTVSDWKYIMEVESKSVIYSGICFKRDSLECTGLKDSAQYFAAGDSAVMVDRFGHVSATKTVDNGFYSLRCIKYRTIVEKMSDLPDCGSGTYDSYSTIYVATKDSSYYCSYGEWKNSSGRASCRSEESGEKYLIKDIVYICKSGYWQQTTIEDTDVECTDENLYEEYVVNGIRYACTDTGMAKLNYPASVLGLCTPEKKGSLAEPEKDKIFICSNNRWVGAMPGDVFGACGASNYGQLEIFEGRQVVCSLNSGWRSASDTELEIGACTPALKDSIRRDSAGRYYRCYKDGGWREANSAEVLGHCDEGEQGDSATYKDSLFVCMDSYWNYVDSLERVMGLCYDRIYGARGEYAGNVYYCQVKIGSQWIRATETEEKWGYCPRDTTFIKELDGEFYKCDRGTWKESSLSEVFPYCRSTTGQKKVYRGIEYVCDTSAYQHNGEWYAMTSLDSALGGYCRTSILNKGVLLDGQVYVCKVYVCKVDSVLSYKKSWRLGTMQDYMRGCTEKRFGERMFNGLDTSVCVYNMCSNNTPRAYYYDGKSTNTCIEYTSGYMWQPIVRDSLKDKRDGKVYGVITIGSQKWLNHDLQYWKNTVYGSSGYTYSIDPMELTADAGIYKSYYYTWADAMGTKDICPDGSHIPSLVEWKTLFDYAQKMSSADGLLALYRRWDNRTNYVGTDLYGLGLRKNGYVDMDFLPPGNNPRTHLNNDYMATYYWVSDVGESDSMARAIYVDTTMTPNYQTRALKEDAYTIRCIVD